MRKPPSIFVCVLTCFRTAAGNRSRCRRKFVSRCRVNRKRRSQRKFPHDSSSTILRRCLLNACSSKTQNFLYTPHVLLSCRTCSMSSQELAGAYRAGNTDEIIRAHGIKGLYTNTVFRYDEKLFLKIGSALELGRSFVRPEYQRQYAPLLLLWKG